ncbi:FG-GAP and VCBS repeat-containing protein [Streptomyces sp. WMMB 322]|uniref:FG-GAP and VCBS repeat-containing protein n=1 Tax=Streptomyces sp. WMMB 322 TaxID=1286821 RepID=UPI0006E2248D|nr:FG-GAP and VCBS repeat-containing protein [Streptomyces sp. WMMB 322]SCK38832.1 FG-GAP repeat-containing protein [Streptomyces sp. WMMB 322]
MRVRTLCAVVAGLAVALTGGAASAAGQAGLAGAAAGKGGTTGAVATAGTAPEQASVQEDFNGDGFQDVATAAPGATIAGQTRAGYVVVTYGSASGLSAGSSTYISQNTAGVPGTAETDDFFGARLIARDLDGDGLTDLAVRSSSEQVTNGYGSVTVLWGRQGGISGEDATLVEAPSDPYWEMGANLTAGDFDGDGATDLFMQHGGDWESRSVLFGPFTRDGKAADEQQIGMFTSDNDIFVTTAGDMTGDGIDDLATFYVYQNHAEGGRFWRGTESGLSTQATHLNSAAAAAVGDFDKDGKGDLATRTVPGGITEDLPYDSGTVKIYYGTADGPSATRTRTITQNSAGVPGTSENGDQFGARLDANDVNGDGYADLAAGVPFEAIGTKKAAGAVVLLKGGSGGLSGTGAQAFHQDTSGIPGVAEADDRFGGAVRLLDVTKDGKAELAVSAPEENDTGAVWSLRGTAGGLTATGSLAFNPVDLGTPSAGAGFGYVFSNEPGTFLYTPY